MSMFRRTVVFLLLLTAPFQAALGATGMLCASGGHHAQDGASALHSHDTAAATPYHHGVEMMSAYHDPAADPGSHESHGTSGKCTTCSEYCSAVAPISASLPTSFPPDTPLRVSSIVEPDIVSRAGDGLFRPPRTTSD